MQLTISVETTSHEQLLSLARMALGELEAGNAMGGHTGPDGRWEFAIQFDVHHRGEEQPSG